MGIKSETENVNMNQVLKRIIPCFNALYIQLGVLFIRRLVNQ